MARDELMAEVDKRTNLAFTNEMEMLTFFLTDRQLYGLNVFKIIEIRECPKVVTRVPHSHPAVKGEINFRDRPVALIDLSEFLGLPPTDFRNEQGYVLICEYSRTVQGLLVAQPNVLMTKGWDEVIKPKGAIYDQGYLTAIAYDEGRAIQLLDVEKILSEIIGIDIQVSGELVAESKRVVDPRHHILAVDDSKAACSLMAAVLGQMGIRHTVVNSAPEALALLAAAGGAERYTVVFTDLEMPIMDGFTFTRKVRENPRLAKVHLAIHSSLSNKSNREKAREMGANDFVPKFTPDNVVSLILEQIRQAEKREGAP